MEQKNDHPVFLATFKAYYPIDQTIQMIEKFLEKVKKTNHEVLVGAPLDYLPNLLKHFKDNSIHFGTEMMLSAEDHSFTQSITGTVLKNLSCHFAIIGSSDERYILSATENSLKKKLLAALECGIVPILAIGDTLHDFDDGHSIEVMKKQLHEDLADLSQEQLKHIKILYDAPWITNSCWGDNSEYVPKAFASFCEVIKEFFGENSPHIPLFFSIPCFAKHLPKVPSDILCQGYYFGVMTPSHTIEPIESHHNQVVSQEDTDKKEAEAVKTLTDQLG